MTKRTSAPPPPSSPKTKTLPESLRGAFHHGPDEITALRLFGTAHEFPLPREQKTFTLGAEPHRDVALPEGYLSRLHCTLDRRHGVLRVTDNDSSNGTFFGGRQERAFELRPGGTFTCGPFTFLALNDEMRAAYPTLASLLGPESDRWVPLPELESPTPSGMIVLATGGRHLLFVAEPGCGQEQLARTTHAISLLRSREPVILDRVPGDRAGQRAILDRASRSTLILALDGETPVMDAAFVSSVFSTSFRIRVIAHAPTVDKANQVLTAGHVQSMQVLRLPSLAFRRDAIPGLMDHAFAASGAGLRFSKLTDANRRALEAYGWPKNFDDLTVAARRLDAIATAGSLRKAASVLGLGYSTLQEWFSQLGLSQPVVASEEVR